MFYIICYDTPSVKRRRKMAKTILGYGKRVQKSVYEANLEKIDYINMLISIEKILDEKEDNVRVYQVPKDSISNIEVYGAVPILEDTDYEYS